MTYKSDYEYVFSLLLKMYFYRFSKKKMFGMVARFC